MVKPYIPDRGDIIYIDFSPQVGHEQAKRRPALVLTPRAYNGASGLAIVLPITSKLKGRNFEVQLPPTLATQGAILSDRLNSFDWQARKAVFEEPAPDTIVDEVSARVAALLGLP